MRSIAKTGGLRRVFKVLEFQEIKLNMQNISFLYVLSGFTLWRMYFSNSMLFICLFTILGLNLYFLEIIHILYLRCHLKILERVLKNPQKKKYVCFNEITWLTVINLKMKMNNSSHGYNINRCRLIHGSKYTKY